jgi:hypothetical protein
MFHKETNCRTGFLGKDSDEASQKACLSPSERCVALDKPDHGLNKRQNLAWLARRLCRRAKTAALAEPRDAGVASVVRGTVRRSQDPSKGIWHMHERAAELSWSIDSISP